MSVRLRTKWLWVRLSTVAVTLNLMQQIIRDDLFSEGRNSLNLKQREVFNVVETWAKDYIKHDELDSEPPHIFIPDNVRTRKSPLLK